MAITSGASPGIIVTSSAKNGTVKSFTGGKVRLEDPITTGNNGNLMASPVYTGRLIHIDGGTGVGQMRYISGQTTGQGDGDDVDLDVDEAWDTNPDGTSTYQISYIIEDAATLTGLTFRSQSQTYESSRRFTVGSGGGTYAFFFLPGDKSWEFDDNGSTTVAATTIENGGRFVVGHTIDEVPVSGAYTSSIQGTAGELAIDCKTGSETFLYDWNLRCSHANNSVELDGGTHIWNRGKTYQGTYQTLLSGTMTIEDWVWEGAGATTDTIRIEDTVNILSCVLTSCNGFTSLDDGLTEVLTVRNCNFVAVVTQTVEVHDDKTWNFVDPAGWLNTSTAIAFQVDDLNEVNKLHSLAITVTDPAGTAIQGAETFVFEGTLNNNLPTANKQTTDANGIATSDVLEEKYTYPSTVFTTATSGDHAVKIYKWLRNPFVSAQTFDDTLALTGLSLPVALSTDSAVSQSDESLAVEGGPGIATIVRHGTGETDIRPVKVLHYDAGTGSVPTIGETMTEGSATGDVLDYEGDGVEGILVLENWNGTEFTNNSNITGGTSTFDATTDTSGGGSSFYEEYTWVWDLGGTTLQDAYNYQAAKFSARRHPIARQDDAASFTDFTSEAKSDATGDVDLLPATPAQNDAFYFGDANFPFERITIDVSTAATTSTISWEYYNGSWTALSGVTDGTTNFTTTGKNDVDFTLPTDWTETTIDGQSAFWVRAVQSNASPVGQPVASQIWLDELIERLIEWGEDEHAYQITSGTGGYRTDRNVANTEGVWLANRGAGLIEAMTSDGGVEYVPPTSVTLLVTVTDESGTAIQNVQVAIYRQSDIDAGPVEGLELMNELTTALGEASETFSYTVDVDVEIRARASSGSPAYFPRESPGTIESTGLSVQITLSEDTIIN